MTDFNTFAIDVVYNLIHDCLTEKETIDGIQLVDNAGGKRYFPDFYLPVGCLRLGFPAKTMIEVKAHLQYDTFARLKEISDSFSNVIRNNRYTLAFVFMEDIPKHIKVNGIIGRLDNSFRILSFDELRDKIKTSIPDYTSSKRPITNESTINFARKKFLTGPNTFFLGAGVSASTGQIPGWERLLIELANRAQGKKVKRIDKSGYDKLFNNCGNSNIIIGRYIQSLFNGNNTKFAEAIHDIFYKGKSTITSPTIEKIGELVRKNERLIKGIITYNFDDLIEQELDRQHIENFPVFGNNEPSAQLPIYHVHGIVDQYKKYMYPPTVVLSEKEYHDIYRRSYDWSNVEQLHALQRSNCFFIGLSMTDPNLRRLIEIAKTEGKYRYYNEARHFAFIETEQDDAIKQFTKREKMSFMKHQEKILGSLGVAIIWYKGFENLPQTLNQLMEE